MYVAAFGLRVLIEAFGFIFRLLRLARLWFTVYYTMTFDTGKLIREVESRKAIWHISSEKYSDRDLKRRKWEEITNIMCEKIQQKMKRMNSVSLLC